MTTRSYKVFSIFFTNLIVRRISQLSNLIYTPFLPLMIGKLSIKVSLLFISSIFHYVRYFSEVEARTLNLSGQGWIRTPEQVDITCISSIFSLSSRTDKLYHAKQVFSPASTFRLSVEKFRKIWALGIRLRLNFIFSIRYQRCLLVLNKKDVFYCK